MSDEGKPVGKETVSAETAGLVRRRYIVWGRVQGVGFRWSAQRRGEDLDLAGWVRNRTDGRVELCVEGPEPTVSQYEAWLAKGPSLARVKGVEKVDVPHDVALDKPFKIS